MHGIAWTGLAMTDMVKKTRHNLPAGPGRPKGVPNKQTAQLKDMILKALDGAGGVTYLEKRANDPRTAAAFLGLVGKVLPMQVTGEGGGPIGLSINVKFD